MTKKNFWMLTAILTCGLMMTACVANEDNEIQQPSDDACFEEFPEQPTTDQLKTLIERPAYVFDANYTGEGKAVVARTAKKVAFSDESLEVVIMRRLSEHHPRTGQGRYRGIHRARAGRA